MFGTPPYDPWRSLAVSIDVAAAGRAPAEAIDRRRRQRLTELLKAAARGSALYRSILHGRDPAQVSLESLPVMRKSDLMARFRDWVTDPDIDLAELRRFASDPSRIADPFLDRYVVWESSGSSGEPGVFVQDARTMAVYDALEAVRQPPRAPALLDPWGLGERIVFIGATDGHFASTVSIERLKRLNPVFGSIETSLSFLQPLDSLLSKLQAISPTVIATYPSVAVLLAEEQGAGRLQIAPRRVLTGGEQLSPAMRRLVRTRLGCEVVNSYGASEFLSLAFECAHGNLHLNEDWAILEPVDRHGIAVPAGEIGETTLLTNLANHVQPLIRYDLGDRVRIREERCDCGSRLRVIDVQGRDDDVLRFEVQTGRMRPIPPLAFTTVLEEEVGLFDFQLIQQGPKELLLGVPSSGPQAEALLRRASARLRRFLSLQGAGGVRVQGRTGLPPRNGRSGKSRRIIALEPRPARASGT